MANNHRTPHPTMPHSLSASPEMALPACRSACDILTPNGTLNIAANNKTKRLTTQQSIASQILINHRRDTRHLHLHDDPARLMREFRKKDIPCELLFDNYLELGQGKYQSNIFHSYGKDTSYLSARLSRSKSMTSRLLKKANLPVPLQAIASTIVGAQKIATQIGFPLVAKPLDGKQGKDIHINLKSMPEVINAFQHVIKYYRQVIIEKFIPGDEFRLLVIGGKLIAAANRMPGRIIGNGHHTIRQLLNEHNKPYLGNDPRRIYHRHIKLDKTARC